MKLHHQPRSSSYTLSLPPYRGVIYRNRAISAFTTLWSGYLSAREGRSPPIYVPLSWRGRLRRRDVLQEMIQTWLRLRLSAVQGQVTRLTTWRESREFVLLRQQCQKGEIPAGLLHDWLADRGMTHLLEKILQAGVESEVPWPENWTELARAYARGLKA